MYHEILVDRTVHAAIGPFLPSHSTFEKHDIPTLIKDVQLFKLCI
jgi:peroxin-1